MLSELICLTFTPLGRKGHLSSYDSCKYKKKTVAMAVVSSNTIISGIPDASLLKISIHRKENCLFYSFTTFSPDIHIYEGYSESNLE
jgi:hypothetical protein